MGLLLRVRYEGRRKRKHKLVHTEKAWEALVEELFLFVKSTVILRLDDPGVGQKNRLALCRNADEHRTTPVENRLLLFLDAVSIEELLETVSVGLAFISASDGFMLTAPAITTRALFPSMRNWSMRRSSFSV